MTHTLFKTVSIAHVNSQSVREPLRMTSRTMRAIESIAVDCYDNDSTDIDLDFSYLTEVNLDGLFD